LRSASDIMVTRPPKSRHGRAFSGHSLSTTGRGRPGGY
jgi:hypothetical protein